MYIFYCSQAQILLALKKKKECNARAQQIVEDLLDPVPSDKMNGFLAKVRLNLVGLNPFYSFTLALT